MSNQYKWFINYCSIKIFARQLSPKIGPFIYFHNVCERSEVSSMRRFNHSRLAFAIKIINSWAGSHGRSDFTTTNHKMHFSK